jgi:hypothetical protein
MSAHTPAHEEAEVHCGKCSRAHIASITSATCCVCAFSGEELGSNFRVTQALKLTESWTCWPNHLSIGLWGPSYKRQRQWTLSSRASANIAPAPTLQHWSSSTCTSLLEAGTTSLPSVQHMPRLLSDTTQVLLCPGSCCLRLAIEVTVTGVLYGGIFCSHSETQEATEMLLQELERLCSCGWLMSCWPLEIWAR